LSSRSSLGDGPEFVSRALWPRGTWARAKPPRADPPVGRPAPIRPRPRRPRASARWNFRWCCRGVLCVPSGASPRSSRGHLHAHPGVVAITAWRADLGLPLLEGSWAERKDHNRADPSKTPERTPPKQDCTRTLVRARAQNTLKRTPKACASVTGSRVGYPHQRGRPPPCCHML